MKKKILLILSLVIIFPSIICAAIYNDYSTAASYTNDYIKKFDSYKLYIAGLEGENIPYNYESHNNLKVNTRFKLGGLPSNFEFKTTKHNNKSWMIDGQEYWTLTSYSSGNNYYINRMGSGSSYKDVDEETGSKITEQILPHTKVTGKGTYSDPWVFIKPEFKITINLENAKVNGTKTFSKTIYQYDANYVVVPDDYYYEYLSHTCDGNLSYNFNTSNGKLSLDNILSNVTCTIKYKKKQYPVNIVLSNSQTDKTSLSVVHGDNGIFNIDPNEGYAYKTASCTNGQSFTYTTHKFTVNNVTASTTCNIEIAKVDSKTYEYLESNQTYTAQYPGYYDFDLYGARGSGNGGKGAKAYARIYLNKGDVITINTGGTNGYNGGGDGLYTGGGATTIKRNGYTLVAAAGGGGGAEGTDGGNGNSAGGAKAHTSGSGTNGGAGSNGTNSGGGGSSYNYSNTYWDPCVTGSNTCVAGIIKTNCSDEHHQEKVCKGGYVSTGVCKTTGTCKGNSGTGYNYYSCSGGSWKYDSATENVTCGSGCTKDYSCGSAPSGSCTDGASKTVTCSGWCDCTCCTEYYTEWDSCASKPLTWVYGCDEVPSDCASGVDTCVGADVTDTASYKSGNGGSNYFDTEYTIATSTFIGENAGNGKTVISYIGEGL